MRSSVGADDKLITSSATGVSVNRLDTIHAASKYVSGPHPVLVLDGVPLDVLIDSARPDLNLLGLVPALLDSLGDAEERALVWRRILPADGCVAVAPVLMCPDDCTLWCSVVVAEVEPENAVVWWRRVGLDISKPRLAEMPGAVGTVVEWFSGLGPYCFRRPDYERCLAAFKR